MNEGLEGIRAHAEEWLAGLPQLLTEIGDLNIACKSSYRDLVTEADRKIERNFRAHLARRYAEHEVLGEESFDPDKTYAGERLWIIDPIDGTTNFVKQKDDFCCILSYFESGICQLGYVYDFKSRILYSAKRGEGVYQNGKRICKQPNLSLKESLVSMDVRRLREADPSLFDYLVKNAFSVRVMGSGGLDGMRVITGKLGAYVHVKGGVWDYSPFFLMAEELGLRFTDFEGNPPALDRHSSFILATPRLHDELMARKG